MCGPPSLVCGSSGDGLVISWLGLRPRTSTTAPPLVEVRAKRASKPARLAGWLVSRLGRCAPLAPQPTTRLRSIRATAALHLAGAADDMVDESVVLRLLRGEPPVALEVELDLFEGLAGVLGDQPGHVALEQNRLL